VRLKVAEDLGGGDALWLVDGYAQLSVGIVERTGPGKLLGYV